jgi:hypothetical protein
MTAGGALKYRLNAKEALKDAPVVEHVNEV